MNIDEALVFFLRSAPAVVTLVGDRVHPLRAPQGPAYPCIVYLHETASREHTHAGASGLTQGRFTIDCLSPKLSEAKAVAEAVRQAIDGQRGTWGDPGGVLVDGAFVEDAADDYVDDLQVYVCSVDVRVLWVEWPAS